MCCTPEHQKKKSIYQQTTWRKWENKYLGFIPSAKKKKQMDKPVHIISLAFSISYSFLIYGCKKKKKNRFNECDPSGYPGLFEWAVKSVRNQDDQREQQPMKELCLWASRTVLQATGRERKGGSQAISSRRPKPAVHRVQLLSWFALR